MPLLTMAGETNATLAGNADQVEFQMAHAFSENFAVLADGGLFIPKDQETGEGGSGKFLELGGGYLHPLSGKWVLEAYGLAGFGSFENHFPEASPGPGSPTVGDISASIFRWGVQPNFGFKSRYFSAALSTRLVNVIYHNVEGDLIFNQVDQVDFLTENNSYWLAEPALTIRGGFEKIKLQAQLGLSYNITDPEFSQESSFITVGLNFNF
ncbi:MAG TPA: hypothetical protein VKZ54_13235 [Membranihabitans sp.]|nr:hypothetical protein [Membranihabitans sp.]